MRLDSLLRPARMPTPESSERLGHVVVQAHVALMLAFALLVALPALGAHRLTFADLGTRCVIVAAVVVQAAWMLRSGERVGQLVLAFGVLVVAAPILVREPIPGETTVGILITSAVLLGARVLVPWAAVISAGLSWVPFVLSAARLGDGTAKGLVLQDYALATAMGMAAVGFVNSLEMLAARSARSAAFTRGRRSALLRQAAETEAVNHAQRILHDDVLGTLQLIINGPLPDLDAPPGRPGPLCPEGGVHLPGCRGEVRAERSGDWSRAAAEDAHRVVIRLHRDASHRAGGRAGQCRRRPEAAQALEQLPQAQTQALERGAREALRNVHRQSGMTTATVQAGADRDTVWLSVRDTGTGIPDRTEAGFGLGESIRGAMVAAGGRAVVVSRPGQGFTVTLEMPRSRWHRVS